jgi:hypothetical protein
MPVRGQGEAELVDVLLVAVPGRDALVEFDFGRVEAARSAPSGEDPLHAAKATKATKATRCRAGRFLIESQR